MRGVIGFKNEAPIHQRAGGAIREGSGLFEGIHSSLLSRGVEVDFFAVRSMVGFDLERSTVAMAPTKNKANIINSITILLGC